VHLNLSNNQLKSISVLANEDKNRLENLRELLLSGNQIEKIPEYFCENQIFRKKLSVLHLSDNRLKSIPSNIYKLSSIRELVLNNNPELQFLPHTIGQVSQSLRVFSAIGCPNLKWYPDSIAR
jgi:Leucine-rich repeat (LRR) protein